jgi:ADP-dependent NAD(P)H-hydrate dehydratase / NAD(P)H-hydrate epimerase
MRPILTPAEAGALDRDSRARGIPVETLMENAGREVARAAAAVAGGLYGRRAVVVCGKGNNGGDGLVAARYLSRWGMRVAVVMLERADDLRDPAATNLRRLDETDVRARAFALPVLERELARADVAIDAIFGTGFRGMPEEVFAKAIASLNEAEVPVVAVDIPSGVNGETGVVDGVAVNATVTVTFGAAKPGAVLFPGAEHAGLVQVVDIGFPGELLRSRLALLEASDVAAALPPRAADTHKRAAGVVTVVGGSRRMTGAVTLAAEAAYRAGAGLVSVAVPASILPVVQTVLREPTFVPLQETDDGTVASGGELFDRVLANADAVAVGPGMTTDDRTASFVRSLVRASPAPVILDADGLNAFVGHVGDLPDRKSPLVMTPHAGEFARLTGTTASVVGADRVAHARRLASETDAIVLLKGSRTVIASPDGSAVVNPTGGPYLATGGTGDVLTGVIAAFVARGVQPADAAAAAAYVHGLAGQLAGRERGEGATAGDVLARVSEAIREVVAV